MHCELKKQPAANVFGMRSSNTSSSNTIEEPQGTPALAQGTMVAAAPGGVAISSSSSSSSSLLSSQPAARTTSNPTKKREDKDQNRHKVGHEPALSPPHWCNEHHEEQKESPRSCLGLVTTTSNEEGGKKNKVVTGFQQNHVTTGDHHLNRTTAIKKPVEEKKNTSNSILATTEVNSNGNKYGAYKNNSMPQPTHQQEDNTSSSSSTTSRKHLTGTSEQPSFFCPLKPYPILTDQNPSISSATISNSNTNNTTNTNDGPPDDERIILYPQNYIEEASSSEDNLVYFNSPNQNDVLCGRGNAVQHHPGNIFYRKVIKTYFTTYLVASRNEKLTVACNIVDTVQSNKRNPPGRFVKYDPHRCLWHEISKRERVSKVRQALREGASTARLLVENDLAPAHTGDLLDLAKINESLLLEEQQNTAMAANKEERIIKQNTEQATSCTTNNKKGSKEGSHSRRPIAKKKNEEIYTKTQQHQVNKLDANHGPRHNKGGQRVKHKKSSKTKNSSKISSQKHQENTISKKFCSTKPHTDMVRKRSNKTDDTKKNNSKNSVSYQATGDNSTSYSNNSNNENAASFSRSSSDDKRRAQNFDRPSINVLKRKHSDITKGNDGNKNVYDKKDNTKINLFEEEAKKSKNEQSQVPFKSNTCSKCDGRGLVVVRRTSSCSQQTALCVPTNQRSLSANQELCEEEDRGAGIVGKIQRAEQYFNLSPSRKTYPQRIYAIQHEVLLESSYLRPEETIQQESELLDDTSCLSLTKALDISEQSAKLTLKSIVELENNWGIVGTENVSIINRVDIIEKTALKYKRKLESFM